MSNDLIFISIFNEQHIDIDYFQGSCDILHGVLNLKSISTPESTLVQDNGKELKLKVLETPVQLKR